MRPARIAFEIAKNLAAALIPWRSPLDYYDDWKSYGERTFQVHIEALEAQGFTLAGRDVLEIGPGPTLWSIYLCLMHGAATATAIDIRRSLVSNGSPDDALSRIRYLVPYSAEKVALPTASFDLIYSQAVLEHVRAPKLVVAEQWRLLRAGGLVSHQIDTRNHFDFSRPTEHLGVPEIVWKMMTSNRSVFTNRLTIKDWIDLFASQEFDVLEAQETASIERPGEPDGGLLIRCRKSKEARG